MNRRTFLALASGGLLAVPVAATAQQPALQRVAEAFAAINRSFVAPPDPARLMVGALEGLEQALPAGVLHVSESAGGVTVIAQSQSGPSNTTTFPPPTSIDAGLQTVGAVYEITRRLAPDIPANVLTSAILRQAVSRLDPQSSFLDRDEGKTVNTKARAAVQTQMVQGAVAYIKIDLSNEQFPGPHPAIWDAVATGIDLEIYAALAEAERAGMTAVVLDLRNNDSGKLTAAVEVSEVFLKERQLICYMQGRTRQQGLRFSAHPRRTGLTSFLTLRKGYPVIPLAVLVNNKTAGAAEIVAAALQDWKRALVVGAKTLGDASIQMLIPLSDGSQLRLTTAEWFTPKGRSVRSSGVTPDVSVESMDQVDSARPDQTGADALVARDVALQRALQSLKALPSGPSRQ